MLAELQLLRGQAQTWTDQVLTSDHNLLAGERGKHVEIVAELDPGAATALEFNVRTGKAGRTTVSYYPRRASVSVNRNRSSVTNFVPAFPGTHTAFLPTSGRDSVKLHVFLDECSIEVVANDGDATISHLIFPGRDCDQLEIIIQGGRAFLKSLAIYPLAESRESSKKLNRRVTPMRYRRSHDAG